MKAILLALALLAAPSDFPYRPALPGYRYTFPRDHFEHPDFRTEWWYYTGALHTSEGKHFGFELVFFRQGRRRQTAGNPSAWRVDDLYLAHLALTDVNGKRFYPHVRLNRAGPGVAGASFDQRRVWNGNWSSEWRDTRQTLTATTDEFGFQLQLDPQKPPVIHGENGVSQKAERPGRASHYVSFTRLAVTGKLRLEGTPYDVAGSAWMDHEWFTEQLDPSQIGWDWFSIQLNDGRDLMLFQLRSKNGGMDPYSSGTYIDAQGVSRRLTSRDFSLTPERYWISPKTNTRYPVSWKVHVPSMKLELTCDATLDSQELPSENTDSPTYWEGLVRYSGSATGSGYLEMTGYDKPVVLK